VAAVANKISVGVGEWITLSAQRHPDKACFVYADGTQHTFGEIDGRVNRLADALRAEGFARGDRIAVLALDSHRYIETVLAAMKIGATYMPLNWRLARGEVATLAAKGEPRGLFFDSRYAPLVDGLGDDVKALQLMVCYDTSTDAGPGLAYETLIAGGEDREPEQDATDDDLFGLAFTSGTTGLPKGVMQSRRMIRNMVTACLIDYRAKSEDLRYCASPLFHVTGSAMMLMGVALGYTSLITPQFDPDATIRYLQEDRLTACFLVPTMISMLLQRPELEGRRCERLELMMYGAAPMSAGLLKRAIDTFDCDFLNLFGAGTEAGLQTILTVEDHRRAMAGETQLLGSIGRAATSIALKITDEDLNEVPIGTVGEITTRSDMVMDGYLDMPEETARSLRDGWFRAGDLAYRDEDGYLYLAGRKNDMIIRGGENVYPIEIESVLADHPAVALVSVVGVPDEKWGETVRAWLVLRPGTTVDAAELTAFCRARLATYKVPSDFRVEPALPMNASGKILKRELRLLA
jgi:acyl-CoA synthetase (AMP-forming)/AMP-acid ligase II